MPEEQDARVQAVVTHWAPRLIAAGVDYNDFQRTLARIRRWEDWCVEWQRAAAYHEQLAREALSPISAGEAYLRAAPCHHFGKYIFFEAGDEARAASQALRDNYAKAAPLLDPPSERVLIPYAGKELPGNLRKPDGISRPPVMLLLAGLDSVKEEFATFEPLFHRRGLATLAFDGPGQGEMEHDMAIEPAFEKVITAVVDWLQTRQDVDGRRVACGGVSLGGYYTSRAAAYEPRLRCAVSMGGPYDFSESLPTMPPMSQQAFQARSFSPSREAAFEKVKELTLRDCARLITMPFLIIFGKADGIIDYHQAERQFAEMPSTDKRLELYEDGNHIVNNYPYAYRPLVADWVAQRLAG